MVVFLDTNILIYAFSSDDRNMRARALLAEPFVLGVQSLSEFVNASRRKLNHDWETLEWALGDIVTVCSAIQPLTLDVHIHGLAIAERYGLQFYDSTLLAAAIKAGCTAFLSEDMQDGMVIENRLTIRNPFA